MRRPSRQNRFNLSLAVLALLLIGACGTVLPPPTKPVVDNPIDPESPSFVPPETYIVSGPTNGSTIDTPDVTIEWEGNEGATIFQHRLNGSSWTNWSTQASTVLEYLDEGLYQFEVRSAYPPVSGEPAHIDTSAASISFTVDAVEVSSLRLSPRYIETSTSQSFQLELIAEEVNDLMGLKAVIKFSPAALSAVEVTDGDFLASNGGAIVSHNIIDNTGGTIEINMAVATGDPTGVSGTGAVAVIQFIGQQAADTDITIESGTAELRNNFNLPITINALVGTRVKIR